MLASRRISARWPALERTLLGVLATCREAIPGRGPVTSVVPLLVGAMCGIALSESVPRSMAERLGPSSVILEGRIGPLSLSRLSLSSDRVRLSPELDLARIEHEAHPTPENLRALGLLELATGDYDAAVAHLRKAVSTQALNASWRGELALAYMVRAKARTDQDPLDRVRALEEVERALQIEPTSHSICMVRRQALTANTLDLLAAEDERNCDSAQTEPTTPPSEDRIWEPIALDLLKCQEARREFYAATARKYPQELREFLQDRLLPHWAELQLRNYDLEARNCLTVAWLLGQELARWNGEDSALASVEAIRHIKLQSFLDRMAGGLVSYGRGRKLYERGRPEEARPQFDQALIMIAGTNRAISLWTELWIGGTEFFAGRHRNAAERFARTIKRLGPTEFPALHARLLWAEGLQYVFLGDYTKSLALYHPAEALFLKLDERANAGALAYLLAEDYRFLGDLPTATIYRWASLERLRSARGAVRRLNVLLQSSQVWEESFPHAAYLFAREALIAASAYHEEVQLSEALIQIARVGILLNGNSYSPLPWPQVEKAISVIQSKNIRERIAAELLLARSTLAAAGIGPSEAKWFTQLENRATKIESPTLLAATLTAKAQCILRQGRHIAALGFLERAIHLVDSVSETISDRRLEALFRESWQFAFDDVIAIQVQKKAQSPITPLLLLERARYLMTRAAPLRPLDISKFNKLRASLPYDETIVAFSVLPTQVIIWSIRADAVDMRVIRVDRQILRRQIQNLETAIASNGPRMMISKLSLSLYGTLIAPVGLSIKGRYLTIVADRELEALPFSLLVDRDNRLVIDKWAVAYARDLRAALHAWAWDINHWSSRGGSALIVGSSIIEPQSGRAPLHLPGAIREAASIASEYPKAILLLGKEATPSVVKKLLPAAQIFHFAGHGITAAQGSSALGLMLSKDGKEYDLSADEIAGLNLSRMKFVTLSMCGAGAPDQVNRLGMATLPNSFGIAGAKAVVANLWPISDLFAGEFASEVHRAFREKSSFRGSIRRIQLARARRDEKSLEWSGFKLVVF